MLDGLRRLEYRGYDSAGVAIVNGDLLTAKRAGKLANLEKALSDELIQQLQGALEEFKKTSSVASE